MEEKPKFSKKALEEAIDYIFRERHEKPKERKIKITQWCSTINGFRQRFPTPFDINVCDSEDCYSCREFSKSFHKAIQEEVKKYGIE